MRSKNVVAAVVVEMGLGTGLATVVAIPADAEPLDEQVDPVFLKDVSAFGSLAVQGYCPSSMPE